MQDGRRSPRTYEEYTVIVVCTIELEMSAVRYILDIEHRSLLIKEGDFNIYILGVLKGHNVVLACLPGNQGKGSAAIITIHIARTFPSIKVPSNKHNIRLGDVMVSMPEGQYGGVVQYDLRKETDDSFVLKGFLSPPPPLLRGAIVKIQSDHLVSENKAEEFLLAILQRGRRLSIYRRPSADLNNFICTKCDQQKSVLRLRREFEGPEIYYGLIASGDRVMRNTAKRSEVIRNIDNILCFEIEAAGLITEFSCIIIRGISDYTDSHKNNNWQHYAAITAATCTKELLSYIDPEVASAIPVPSIDVASNQDNRLATYHIFHSKGV
ncbi:nucleoside phosphorylase domain-containing protein [Dactylonectria macrodidyma]|uniref:Nucleoside phosphorylase domain-containing protein n=1 Tax=Dactylonectria macrodidyma TaxID=307937 RepID=A0A9P9EWU4_9HYPO|nr:nucleoside phosphorylase domain-containing protein [Dactylonectria macrodidyma]